MIFDAYIASLLLLIDSKEDSSTTDKIVKDELEAVISRPCVHHVSGVGRTRLLHPSL
jgi:hypothetical protein